MKVSVLIVNYNGRLLLEACFLHLRALSVQPHQVIVVDNASQDGSVEWLLACDYGPLECIFLDENTGFAGGNNAGLPRVTGDVVALLNTDAEVDRRWIEAALPHFSEASVGMVACRTRRLGQMVIDKVGHLMFPDGLNRGRGTGLPDDGRFDRCEEVLWPDGSAGFYRKAMLDEIGFLEDRFFLYGEDAELGMRARWAGWSCVYEPESIVEHHHSAGLGRFSPQKAYYIERNRIWLLFKTFPWPAILLSPWFTLLRYAMNVVSLLSGKGSAAGFRKDSSSGSLLGVLWRANRDGFLGIPTMLALRSSYPRRISGFSLWRLLWRNRISAREITLQD